MTRALLAPDLTSMSLRRPLIAAGLVVSVGCGLFPTTLEKAVDAEKEGRLDEANDLYVDAFREPDATPATQIAAAEGNLRVRMAKADQAPISEDAAIALYREATGFPGVAANAETWLARHSPNVASCLKFGEQAANPVSWSAAYEALEPCIYVYVNFCKSGTCPRGEVPPGEYLPVAATANKIIATLTEVGVPRLQAVTGVGHPVSNLEDKLTDHWTKGTTEGPTALPWPSDGQTHRVNRTAFKVNEAERKYRKDNLMVFSDADTGNVLGVQAILLDLPGDTGTDKVKGLLGYAAPSEPGLQGAAEWLETDTSAFQRVMQGELAIKRFDGDSWGMSVQKLASGTVVLTVID
jgi:hypothetical protein